jgi:hypothetical protein
MLAERAPKQHHPDRPEDPQEQILKLLDLYDLLENGDVGQLID